MLLRVSSAHSTVATVLLKGNPKATAPQQKPLQTQPKSPGGESLLLRPQLAEGWLAAAQLGCETSSSLFLHGHSCFLAAWFLISPRKILMHPPHSLRDASVAHPCPPLQSENLNEALILEPLRAVGELGTQETPAEEEAQLTAVRG